MCLVWRRRFRMLSCPLMCPSLQASFVPNPLGYTFSIALFFHWAPLGLRRCRLLSAAPAVFYVSGLSLTIVEYCHDRIWASRPRHHTLTLSLSGRPNRSVLFQVFLCFCESLYCSVVRLWEWGSRPLIGRRHSYLLSYRFEVLSIVVLSSLNQEDHTKVSSHVTVPRLVTYWTHPHELWQVYINFI